jgi:acyl carrier protein
VLATSELSAVFGVAIPLRLIFNERSVADLATAIHTHLRQDHGRTE